MDRTEAIKALRLFNEKADKLESLSFTRNLSSSGVTISGKQGEAVQAQRQGPDGEAIDAFVLTIRFFVQDNETISLRNIADLYAGLQVDKDLVDKFSDARTKTNATLGKQSPIKLNNTDLTFRAIFEVFLWGGLAHANPRKKEVYDTWVLNPILFPLLQNEFVYTLGIVLNMIFFTRELNKVVLAQLESS